MAFRQVEYKGVHFFPPEDDACLVFSWGRTTPNSSHLG